MKRAVSICATVALVLGLSLCIAPNSSASGSKVIVDGSTLTFEDEVVGYAKNVNPPDRPQGEDLLTGYSKCVRLAPGKMYAGGTTIAAHAVGRIGVSVVLERAREEDTQWSVYSAWNKFNENSDRVASSKLIEVEGGYYYRVSCIHSAGEDVSSSSTNGIFIEKP